MESYIENHELWKAYQAVCLSGAGMAELQTLARFDIDPLADDAEQQVIDAIEDQTVSDFASDAYKIAREAA
jgi:hypothetical protein